jgi:hypothetical protein
MAAGSLMNRIRTGSKQLKRMGQGKDIVGLLNISRQRQIDAQNKLTCIRWGDVQKSSSSKARAVLTRGAYSQYVSTAKGRQRRWRLFSTFPLWNVHFYHQLWA